MCAGLLPHGYTNGAHKEPLHLLIILLIFVFSILFFLAFHIIFPSYICPFFLFCSILALHSFFYLFQSILFCLFISFFTSHLLLYILPPLQCFPSLFVIMITHKRTNREHFHFFFLFFLLYHSIFPVFPFYFFVLYLRFLPFLFIINPSFFLLISLHSFYSFNLILSHPVFFVLPLRSSFLYF